MLFINIREVSWHKSKITVSKSNQLCNQLYQKKLFDGDRVEDQAQTEMGSRAGKLPVALIVVVVVLGNLK